MRGSVGRATLGVWINYATTAAFQVVFADRFGGGATASAYVLVFSLVVVLGGVFSSASQSIGLPRLRLPDGGINRRALRFLLLMTAGAAAVLLMTVALSPLLSGPLAHLSDVGRAAVQRALVAGCAFIFLQVVAAQLCVVQLGLGRRFLPAMAPAFPSIAGVLAMLGDRHLSAAALLAGMALGSLAEVVVLVCGFGSRPRVEDHPLDRLRGTTVLTSVQLAVLAGLPLIDRVLAGLHGSAGIAHFNYASRSLAVAQQLIIGGLLLSSLGDWSSAGDYRARRALVGQVTRTVGRAAIVLTAAAVVGLVLARPLTALAYQRGSFGYRDTQAVARLLQLALPGFLAEGVSLVVSQILLATRNNLLAVRIGFFSFGVRVVAGLILAPTLGAAGVAIGYSVSNIIVLVAQFGVVTWRLGLMGGGSASTRRATATSVMILTIAYMWVTLARFRGSVLLGLVICVGIMLTVGLPLLSSAAVRRELRVGRGRARHAVDETKGVSQVTEPLATGGADVVRDTQYDALVQRLSDISLTERRWSFIAELPDQGWFVKVPKGAPEVSLATALTGAEELRIATNEFRTLDELASVASPEVAFPIPLAQRGSVIFTRLLTDLQPLATALRQFGPGVWSRPLGQLGEWLAGFHARHPGQTIDGLKLDNLYLSGGGIRVFDPNEFVAGPPEADLGRVCVSMLARDYERARFPSRSSLVACAAMLSGYGVSNVSVEELGRQLDFFRERFVREMRVAVSWRNWHGLRKRLAAAALNIFDRKLNRLCRDLVDLVKDAQSKDAMGSRYSDPDQVAMYRAQQERVSVSNLRLGLLARAERRAFRRLMPLGTGQRVLDIPGGTGKLWPDLTERGYKFVSADRSAMMLDAATGPRPPLLVTDAKALPFASHSFAGVACLRLLHRVPSDDRLAMFREFARVGGWLVFSYADRSGLRRLRYAARSALAGNADWAPFAVSRKGIEAELGACGLAIDASKSVGGLGGLISNEVVIRAVPKR